MTVIAEKVIVVFLADATLPAGDALDAVAARGCCGSLVLPPGAAAHLENLLGVHRSDNGSATLKFPKMPTAFFSAAESARALAKALGIADVHDAQADTAEPAARALLATGGKQLVVVHETVGGVANWTRALVSDLLSADDAHTLVAVVKASNEALPTPAEPNAFRPRQSFEKVDGAYASGAETAAPRRLLLAFYQKDRTRCDGAQRLEEAQVDTLGSYGAMSALMFAQEVAFRLGFAPKYGA
ncbi:hypothetical protein PybrP1_002884 [[Pythium] brassicae (nom. inval.)]|nr:hypothetical protein PybrP1_002884 [[Pythium] brassicae (nom. inval.)]